MLAAWAARYGVDEDLALLICACAAAHAAGPRLDFEGFRSTTRAPAPTLIATDDDTGFHQAVKAATHPLHQIQQELLAQYGEWTAAPAPKDPSRRVIDMITGSLH